jgi:hypothetical protein
VKLVANSKLNTSPEQEFDLHELTMRDMFEATAQVGMCCVAKLAVELNRPSRLNFRCFATGRYDVDDANVSIWTIAGRKKVTCVPKSHLNCATARST